MLAPESFLAWIVIGAIAGWLVGRLVKGYGYDLIGNIVIGILGAGVASLLAPRLGLHSESDCLAWQDATGKGPDEIDVQLCVSFLASAALGQCVRSAFDRCRRAASPIT